MVPGRLAAISQFARGIQAGLRAREEIGWSALRIVCLMPPSSLPPAQNTAQVTAFLGRDLVQCIGGLDRQRLLGPWRGHGPDESREAQSFRPELYGDDHAHPHHELCLLTEGSCLFSLNGRGAVLRAGDLVGCPAGTIHAEAHRKSSRSYRLVWWSLAAADPTLHVTHYSRSDGYRLEFGMSLKTLPAEAHRALARLREGMDASACPEVEGLREALLTLTLALMRRAMAGNITPLDRRAELVERAADFVRSHARGALNLADVARAVEVSPNYLTGLFREVVGVSLGRFILAERMEQAQQLLAKEGARVKEVASEVGFSDPYAFSRAFKRHTGVAPSQWQERRGRKK